MRILAKVFIYLTICLLIDAPSFANDIFVRAGGTAASEGAATGPCTTEANAANNHNIEIDDLEFRSTISTWEF